MCPYCAYKKWLKYTFYLNAMGYFPPPPTTYNPIISNSTVNNPTYNNPVYNYRSYIPW